MSGVTVNRLTSPVVGAARPSLLTRLQKSFLNPFFKTWLKKYLRPRPIIRQLFATTIAIFHLQVMADQTPTPFSAEYKLTKGIMSVGTTKRSLRDKGDGYYVFESITKPSGVAKLFTSGKVVERSHWRWKDSKFLPQEYEYQNSGEQKRDVKLIFNWETNQVTNIINGEPWSMQIEENTLDKLVYQLAIMYDLSEGEETLLYQVADGGKTKTYDIKITKEEKVVTELGVFNTIKIVRTHKDRTTIMWCAKELQYLPVKIEQRRNEDTPITAELVDLSGIAIAQETTPSTNQTATQTTAPTTQTIPAETNSELNSKVEPEIKQETAPEMATETGPADTGEMAPQDLSKDRLQN